MHIEAGVMWRSEELTGLYEALCVADHGCERGLTDDQCYFIRLKLVYKKWLIFDFFRPQNQKSMFYCFVASFQPAQRKNLGFLCSKNNFCMVLNRILNIF